MSRSKNPETVEVFYLHKLSANMSQRNVTYEKVGKLSAANVLKHSLPLFVFVLNIPQSVSVLAMYSDYYAGLLALIVFLFLAFYYISFYFAKRIFSQYSINPSATILSPSMLVVLFLVVGAFLAFTASEIALFSSIQGASGDILFDARAAFTKGRSGLELGMVYLYAMLLKGGLPIAILWLFHVKNKYRWILLALVLFILLLSLEKSLTAMLIVPIAIYYFFVNDRKRFFGFVALGMIFLVLASVLSKASDLGIANFGVTKNVLFESEYKEINCDVISDFNVNESSAPCYKSRFPIRYASLDKNDEYRFLIGSDGFGYFLNRVIWIPFVTSYDSLKYWYDVHGGVNLLGATSLPLAFIFELPYVNIEQAVFISQFGGEDDSPGRANTFFAVDSYINFGFLGVVISSMFCGFLFGWLSRCSQPVVAAAAMVTSYSLASNSLMPMIWSGGILVFVILIGVWRSQR